MYTKFWFQFLAPHSEGGGAYLKKKIEMRVSGFKGHFCLYGEFKASLD